jgi:hypothetical protein
MAVQRWEYRILVIQTEKEYSLDKRKELGLAALDHAGAEGWEAVGICEEAGRWSVLLKRPVPS